MVDRKRIIQLNDYGNKPGPVIYWMQREQRVNDNWGLLYARELAVEFQFPLMVVFCLPPKFLEATLRHYHFMIEGLKETEEKLNKLGINFKLLMGNPSKEIPDYLKNIKAGVLVTDFDPLKIKRKWLDDVAKKINIPMYEVDSHNIVPCRIASDKQEYSAYSLRPKITRSLNEFLVDIPPLKKLNTNHQSETDWDEVYKKIRVKKSIKPVDWIKPGENNAKKTLTKFLREKLGYYHIHRNDPNTDMVSNLSPYLHFGQISAQRIAFDVFNTYSLKEAKDAFLEELIVRKELSDNFCLYNDNYDSVEGFPEWAKKSLDEHLKDKREFIYSVEEFEKSKTHDDLWNAAQSEMLHTGKMHGFMRMYWAKKILEWSETPEEALNIAIYLNDKYSLDGTDPNGYTGIAWSIGGLHDRAWGDRNIFGKVRYMSYNGCKTKFNIKQYIDTKKY